jgi:hypothetical protein
MEAKMLYKHFRTFSATALLLLTLGGTILLLSCKKTEVQSQWSAEPVKVDGEMTEWPSGSTVYFEDSGVQLGLRNDSQNLYILFRFGNQTWARAIRRGGLTLWLDNSGKKKKDFGIRYAGGPSPSEMQKGEMSNRGGFLDSLTPEQQQRLIDMQTDAAHKVIVINKKSDQDITISADGSSGPAVSFGSPEDIYTYEFSLPLQKSDVSHYGIGAQPGQTICLGLEWGGISDSDRQRRMHEGGGMGGGMPPSGEGGMPPGGGPPGGGRGGPGMQTPEKQEIWVKTQLASPPAK